ncbi:MAG: trigger factor [Candidatus Delongbacteria bacterium]|nr:trigger factor [Candidatus Delongbacteria bacterium]MBN2836253.1 trigger factor [Candidatus Delongbacteria bacterium]
MRTEIIQSKDYEKKVLFTVSIEEMKEYYNKTLKDVQKKAKIDGFRQGKAPVDFIEKKFKKSILAESFDHAINESFTEFLKESGINPLSQAKIDDFKGEEGTELTFTAYIEVYPEFQLGQYKELEVEQLNVSVSDDEINAEIDKMRNDFASFKDIDTPIEVGNIAIIDMRVVGTEKYEERTIEVGKNVSEKEVDEQLVGLNKGEFKTVYMSIPEKFKNAEMENDKIEFEVLVKNVQEKVLPDFNDEFVKSVDKKYESSEMFKNEVKENILKNKTDKEEREMLSRLKDKINNLHAFDVPPTIVDRYTTNMIQTAKSQFGQMNIDDEVLKSVYASSAIATIRWQYIREAIIQAENLVINDEDYDKFFEEIKGKSGIDISKIKKYYAPRDKKEMLKQDLLEKKLDEILKQNNKVNFVDALTEPVVEETESVQE